MSVLKKKGSQRLISNVDILKQFLYEKGPSTLDQLAGEICRVMTSVVSKEEAINRYILPVLKCSKYPYFREAEGIWSVDERGLPEKAYVKRVFDEARKPLSDREVRSRIAELMNVKPSSVILDLTREDYLMTVDARWALKDWTIINDQALQYLRETGKVLNEEEIIFAVTQLHKLDSARVVFDPSRDPRFERERKNWKAKGSPKAKEPKPSEVASKITRRVEMELESQFLTIQIQPKREMSYDARKKPAIGRVKLKKAKRELPKPPEEKVEELPVPEVVPMMMEEAEQIPTALPPEPVMEDIYATRSFQKFEGFSFADRVASPALRDEITRFLESIGQEQSSSASPLRGIPIRLSGAITPEKIEEVLQLKHPSHRQVAHILPMEYCELAAALTDPSPDDLVLDISLRSGTLAVSIMTYLLKVLDGGHWALDENSRLSILLADKREIALLVGDDPLLEKAADLYEVGVKDILDFFVRNNYCGIERDPVLYRASKYKLELMGFERPYFVDKDFLTQLALIFGQESNERDEISVTFDCLFGNLAFREDPNRTALYIEKALGILEKGGKGSFFVESRFLSAIKEHPFLQSILDSSNVAVLLNLKASGAEDLFLISLKKKEGETKGDEPPVAYATISDLREVKDFLPKYSNNVQDSGIEYVPQSRFASLLPV